MEARDHRQLLAIMFTDVVGYTALTERDEAAALIPNVRFEVVEGGHREGIGNTPKVRAQILAFFDEEPSGAAASR